MARDILRAFLRAMDEFDRGVEEAVVRAAKQIPPEHRATYEAQTLLPERKP